MQLRHKEALGNYGLKKYPKWKTGRHTHTHTETERERERERYMIIKRQWEGWNHLENFLEWGGGGVETGFLCIALAILELTLKTRLASNSEIHLPMPPKC